MTKKPKRLKIEKTSFLFPNNLDINDWLIKKESEEDIKDEFGVTYSANRKILKKFPYNLSIEEYDVINGCIRIENNAFEGEVEPDPEFGLFYLGNKLKKLNLPASLHSIGKNALEGCRNIKSLIIPNMVCVISNDAFNGCHSLKKIELPSSLSELGDNVFPLSLEKITCHSPNFYSCGGCLLSKTNELLWIPPNIKTLNLPKKVIYKGINCFTHQNCIISIDGKILWTVHDIPTFTFPNTVKIIGKSSFIHNRTIREIRIPEGVVEIEYGAFSCNQSLEDVYLPNSIKEIGSLRTYQGWGRKYIEFFYPKRVHIPKGTSSKFLKLLPGIIESQLIEDYNLY